ncbi:MAG: glycosyltransferase [bacterium]
MSGEDGHINLPVIACVTAYNEEATIGSVLSALSAARLVDGVQLVDDGSTDNTKNIAKTYNIKLIGLAERRPVGRAIMHHLDDIETNSILIWCDADLRNLTSEMIDRLIEEYRKGQKTQVMSSRGVPESWSAPIRRALRGSWAWFFGPLSGERVILYSDFKKAITLAQSLGWSEMMQGYGIVIFLNWYAMEYGKGNKIIYFDQLQQRQKYQKWGFKSIWQMPLQWVSFAKVWVKIRVNHKKIKKLYGTEEKL